ncbi:MAG: murein DD-endopeptidase MepM/ murein hydrolase activator NlpD [Kiritimatiellia bacterium]
MGDRRLRVKYAAGSLVGLAVFGLTGWVAVQNAGERVVIIEAPPAAPTPPELALAPDRSTVPVRIGRGSTFGQIMHAHGLPVHAIRKALLPTYDLARIRPDRELQVTYVDGENRPIAVRYQIDEDRTAVVDLDDTGEWRGRVDEVSYDSSVGRRQFVIDRSLWQDGLEAGLRPADLARLASIFEYELDFNTELRKGAELALVAEILTTPEREPRLGELHAVRLRNGEKNWTAVHHRISEDKDGWYRPDGMSLLRPFLRSPLEFSRVTSGFNPRRFHPILKKRRPHNGTDFGAPSGTPVRAVSAGTVVRAGWAGGHGNYVKLKHEGPYETSYSHLSKVRVKRGQKVQQGELVGNVGKTGLATGPHLHYQMWINGRYVDAMRSKLPNQSPLPSDQREAFNAEVARWVPLLDPAVAQ